MNKKKIIKYIIITLFVIVILALSGAFIFFQYVVKPNVNIIDQAVSEIINDETIMEEIDEYIKEQTEEGINEPTTKEEDSIKKDQTKTQKKPSSKKVGPSSDYKTKEEYIKQNVPPADFAKGMALASKVDVPYLLGILSGGITKNEVKELKKYLKQRLTGAEISQGIALYSKYSYLLK